MELKHCPQYREQQNPNFPSFKEVIPAFEYYVNPDKEGEISFTDYQGNLVTKKYKGTVTCKMIYLPSFDESPMIPRLAKENASSMRVFDRVSVIRQAVNVTEYYNQSLKNILDIEEITCTAYCDANDEFSIERGKAVARNKCKFKYYTKLIKALTSLKKELNEIADMCEKASFGAWREQINALNFLDSVHQ